MSNILPIIPHEVEFRPSPEGASEESRDLVAHERRKYSGELALIAAKMDKEREASNIDPITGLPNLKALEETLPYIIAKAHEIGEPVAVMSIDVMGLKRTNDGDGHKIGNGLLRSVRDAFDGLLREDDEVYRVGGDEFVAVLLNYEPLPGESEEQLNTRYATRIRGKFAEKAAEAGVPEKRKVGLSVGITTLRPGDDYESVTGRADKFQTEDHQRIYEEHAANGITFKDRRLDV